MPGLTTEALNAIFTYHAPSVAQTEQYLTIREEAKEFAKLVLRECPESAEATLAIRHIQQAVMFANAAIAIHTEEK